MNKPGRLAFLRAMRACATPLGALLLGACGGRQSALDPQGPMAERLALFFWIMVGVGALILAFVLILMLFGLARSRASAPAEPLSLRQSRNLVLWAGVIIPVVVLLAFTISSAAIDRRDSAASAPRMLTLEVIGHQWWWEVHYLDAEQKRIATTANEIHIPVGQPVRVLLKSHDVIHSFWVPNLNGKTDLIPGKTNISIIEASAPGVFRGQCAEFCGLQHALMGFLVVAEPPAQFKQWLLRQSEPAMVPTSARLLKGQQVFLSSQCVMCHAVRGTRALAQVAPDLTHFGSRLSIAAATVPNVRGHLGGWIADPHGIKPGNFMPPSALPPDELFALLDYLESLK